MSQSCWSFPTFLFLYSLCLLSCIIKMSLHLWLQLSLILIDSCGLSNDPESDAHSSDSDRTDQDQRTRKVRWFILYPFQQPLRCSSCLHQSPPRVPNVRPPILPSLTPLFFHSLATFLILLVLPSLPFSINLTATHGTELTCVYNYQDCLMKHTHSLGSVLQKCSVSLHTGERKKGKYYSHRHWKLVINSWKLRGGKKIQEPHNAERK